VPARRPQRGVVRKPALRPGAEKDQCASAISARSEVEELRELRLDFIVERAAVPRSGKPDRAGQGHVAVVAHHVEEQGTRFERRLKRLAQLRGDDGARAWNLQWRGRVVIAPAQFRARRDAVVARLGRLRMKKNRNAGHEKPCPFHGGIFARNVQSR
jgi:hypothetical protein